MAIEWTTNLSTGVVWQDRQHKELFKRINKLLDAMTVGLGKEEVLRLFDFLDEYFVVHFEAEEQAMNRCNYANTIGHLTEHTSFIEDVARLRKETENNVSAVLIVEVEKRVVDWVINHFGGIDKELGECILQGEKTRKGRG